MGFISRVTELYRNGIANVTGEASNGGGGIKIKIKIKIVRIRREAVTYTARTRKI